VIESTLAGTVPYTPVLMLVHTCYPRQCVTQTSNRQYCEHSLVAIHHIKYKAQFPCNERCSGFKERHWKLLLTNYSNSNL